MLNRSLFIIVSVIGINVSFVTLNTDHSSCCVFLSGLLGALPDSRPYHAVPAGEWQGPPVDSSERGAGDISATPRPRVLASPSRLLPRRHSNGASLPHARRRVHWSQESQVCYETAVWDVSLKNVTVLGGKRKKALWYMRKRTTSFCFFPFFFVCFKAVFMTLSLFQQ